MNILVLLRMVPDVVEELEIAPGGKALDADLLRMMLSESDGHALEEAMLLKERYGGVVTVLALDAPEVDDALFTALAKGADRAVKISDAGENPTTLEAAYTFAGWIAGQPDLAYAGVILTGVPAIDDLDGLHAPLVAHQMRLPYLGIVTGLAVDVPAAWPPPSRNTPAACAAS